MVLKRGPGFVAARCSGVGCGGTYAEAAALTTSVLAALTVSVIPVVLKDALAKTPESVFGAGPSRRPAGAARCRRKDSARMPPRRKQMCAHVRRMLVPGCHAVHPAHDTPQATSHRPFLPAPPPSLLSLPPPMENKRSRGGWGGGARARCECSKRGARVSVRVGHDRTGSVPIALGDAELVAEDVLDARRQHIDVYCLVPDEALGEGHARGRGRVRGTGRGGGGGQM